MPITKSAIRTLAKDRRRNKVNKKVTAKYREAVKKMRLKSTKANLKLAASALDKAVKKNVIHKNKANRLKSRLTKLL